MFSRRTRWICASCLGVACCLFILYQFFPSLFSLLIDYYPVAVCTTIFLGILLSFAEPNFLRYQNVSVNLVDTNSSLNISSVTNDLSARNDEWSDTKNAGSISETKILAATTIVLGGSSHNEGVKVEVDVNHVDAPVCSSSVDENNSEKDVIKNEKEFTEKPAEVLFKVRKDAVSGENCSAIFEKINLVMDKADDSCSHSPQHHIDRKDAASDSGSDGFDFPISNVAPVIDELDPLVSKDNTDDGWVASLQTNAPDDSSADEEEIEFILHDEDDEEEQEDKEDENKVAITWTADDQRNVMELGNSEIEKNRCLENVLAARKAMKMMEKNLIQVNEDRVQILQSRSQLASVNVPRRNPFDLPYDSDASESFPASAPSVLLIRQNPFDVPFEQVVDFVDNSTPREFAAAQQRDAFTRRFESFNVGSVLELKPEKCSLSFKPYFIPERNELDDMTYLDLHRVPSELSDSKMSSTSDSDTGSSSTDQEPGSDLHQYSVSSTKDDMVFIEKEAQTIEVFKPVEFRRFWSQVKPYDELVVHHDLEIDDTSQESMINASISDGERAKDIDDAQYEANSLNPSEEHVELEEQTHGGSSEGSTGVSDDDHNEAMAKLGEQTHGGSSKGSNAGSIAEHVGQGQDLLDRQIYASSVKCSNAELVEVGHAPQGEETHGGSSKSSPEGKTHDGSSKVSPGGSVAVHAPRKYQMHGGSLKGSAPQFDVVQHVPEEEPSHESRALQPVYDANPTASERAHPNAAPDEAFHLSDKEGCSPPAAIAEKNASPDEPRKQESVKSAYSTTWIAPSSMALVEQNESVISELDVIGDEVSRVHEDLEE